MARLDLSSLKPLEEAGPSFDVSGLTPLEPVEDAGPTFSESFGRGVDLAQSMGYGFAEAAGEATGLEAVTEFGREGRVRNLEEAGAYPEGQAFSNIEGFDDFGAWVKDTLGEQIPLMAPSVVGAGAGGAAGFASPIPGGTIIGSAIGAFVPSFVLGVGETQSAIKEKDPDIEAPEWAFAGGSAIAALDTVLPGKIGSQLVRKFGKEAAEQVAERTLKKRVAVEGGKGMATESFTEAMQEAIGEVSAAKATGQPVDVETLKSQMVEAAAAGGLMGGGVQGGMAVFPDKKPQSDDDTGEAPQNLDTSALKPVEPETPQTDETTFYDPDLGEAVPVDKTDESSETVSPEPAQPEMAVEPTEAQKEAGNYKKQHVKWNGLDISIETPKGATRSGTDAGGKPWSVDMQAHYGYVRRTKGADGDQVDVYLGPDAESDSVFIVDQNDAETGAFDEHKVILGATSLEEARDLYLAHFSDGKGPDRLGNIKETDTDGFKDWLANGDTTAPAMEQPEPVEMPEPQPQDTPKPSNIDARLRNYVNNTSNSLKTDRIAEGLGISEEEARAALARLASGQNSGIRVDKMGNARREAKDKQPVDVAKFIARKGGVRDDEGHNLVRGRNLQKFIPGAGQMIRTTGMSIDEAGEALWEAGYFGPMETTPRPSEADVLDLLEKTADGKVMAAEDQAAVSEQDITAENERQEEAANVARKDLEDSVRAAMRELSENLPDEDISAIADILEQNPAMDVFDATEIFVERMAVATIDEWKDNGGHEDTDIPFDTSEPRQAEERLAAGGQRQERGAGTAVRREEATPDTQQTGRPEGASLTALQESPQDAANSTPARELFVEYGNQRIQVPSFEEASRRYLQMVNAAGTGGSETPNPLITDADGNVVGHMAYNGRVFEGRPEDWSGETRVLYDSRKPGGTLDQTAAERQRDFELTAPETSGNSAEYEAALEKHNQAGRKFEKVRQQYRSMQIGDEEFMAAQAEYNEATAAFDEAFAKEQARPRPKGKKSEDDSQSDMFGTTDADREASARQKNRQAVEDADNFGNQRTRSDKEQQPADSDGGLFEDAKKRDQGSLDVEARPLADIERDYLEAIKAIDDHKMPDAPLKKDRDEHQRLIDKSIAIEKEYVAAGGDRLDLNLRASEARESGKPFDSAAWSAGRDATIKKSKADGNTHLDQVDASVETLRGKKIYNAHDPKERGTVRTVANTGDVVVHWDDKYSADKNLADPKEEARGKTVYESWLAPSDLKDYVLADSAKPTISETKASPETLRNWRKTVPHRGQVGGWQLFDDRLVGKGFVLMSDERRVGDFPSEDAARQWAKDNKITSATPTPKPKTGEKIEDFGEKIEGARKDTFTGFRDALTDDVDVSAEPLSKSFPQPNYVKLAAEGVDKRVLAYIAVMRDAIPNKPRKGYKVKRWAEQVEALRSFAQKLLDGDIKASDVDDRVQILSGTRSAFGSALADMPLTVEAIENVAPADLPRAAKYKIRSGRYSVFAGVRYDKPKTFWFLVGPKGRRVTAMSNDPAEQGTHRETPEAAVEMARQIIERDMAKEEKAPERSKYTKVSLYKDRSTGDVFLAFKARSSVIRLQSGFEDAKAARAYLEENRNEIQQKIDGMRKGPNMRGSENKPRSGDNLREGDVTPETFSDAFGFRGVQFGNYVEGGRRQADLNRAYDALMDLADVVGIPPKALSLNGSLGLAFGARGTGGKRAAAAHYEPVEVVINLTKGSGAGSLAHEWLHAVDNYFASQDAGAKSTDYMSKRQRDTGMTRNEVYDAWKRIERTLAEGGFAERSVEFDKTRSKPYWNTTIEKAARAFERYVVDRLEDTGVRNDYLANIDMEGGAYPTANEMEKEGIRDAYDHLFNTIETRETDQGVEMYALRPPHAIAFTRALDRLKAGEMERNEDLPMGLTPPALRLAGLPDLPLVYRQAEARKTLLGKHKDQIDEESLRRLPDLLSDPVMVFSQDNGRFTVLIEDGKGQDVFAVIQPEAVVAGRRANMTVTVHRKDSKNAALKAIADKRVTYRHKDKSRRWFDLASRQLRGREPINGFDENIPTEADLVNDSERRTTEQRSKISENDARKISQKIEQIARNLAPEANVEVKPVVFSRAGDPVAGMYRSGDELIRVSLTLGDPEQTVRHEVIHALRDMGLFTDQEWAALEKEARRVWAERYEVDALYTDLDKTARLEEGIAQAFAEWQSGKGKFKPAFRRLFDRVAKFFRRLANALRGLGYRTVDDVFEAVESGEVGRRERGGKRGGDDRMAAAWHGTPHDFDVFSTDNIGTGEGAQAYGWGLYFAGKKEVAEHYKKVLSGRTPRPTVNGKQVDDISDNPFVGPHLRNVAMEMQAGRGFEEARNLTRDDLYGRMRWAERNDPNEIPMLEQAVEIIDGVEAGQFNPNDSGRLFQVELAPAEDEYLYWDKPLSEQSEKVREALKDALDSIVNRETDFRRASALSRKFDDAEFMSQTGDDFYRWLTSAANDPSRAAPIFGALGIDPYSYEAGNMSGSEAASKMLAREGIPGIKYLDGSSRNQGEGTYNYVIFDDSHVSVTEKYSRFWGKRADQVAKETGTSVEAMKKAGGPLWQQPERVTGNAAQERVLAKIIAEPDNRSIGERIRDGITSFKEEGSRRLRQGMFDQFDAIAHYEKTGNAGKLQDAATSAYKAARLTQNLHSVMHVLLKRGMIGYSDGQFKRVDGFEGGFEGIFEGIAKKGLMKLWAAWAIANRAKRLKSEGRENLLEDADIETLLALEKEYPEFRTVLRDWDRYNKAILDMAQAAGVIDPEGRKVWEQNDYVPFYRVIEDDAPTGPGNKKGIAGQRSGIKTLKGGDAQINDLVENMVMNVTHLVDASFKNVAAKRAIREASRAGVVDTVGMDWTVAHVAPEKAAELLEDIGIQVAGLTEKQKQQMLKIFTMRPPKDRDVVSVLVGGKPKYFRVNDPLLLSALTHMNQQRFDWVTEKVFGGAKRLLTRGVTSFPDFMIANAIRDTMSSWVVTGGKTSPVKAAKGFVSSLKDSASRQAIAAAGGGTAGYYDVTPGDVRHQLDEEFREDTKGIAMKAWEAWNAIGQASENMNRIAIFEKLKSEGASDAEAAFQAMDLMDFSMRGDWAAARYLATTVPFFNARLQGLYKLGRAAYENPKGFAVRGLVITAATMALAAANWDDDRYEELPEWEKDTYYHVWVGDTHIRIPKPFEVGAIFSTLPVRLARFFAGKDDEDKLGEALGTMFLDTFAFNPVPQIAKPIAEQYANKNFFTGSPIESFYQQDLKPGMRVRGGTSALSRELGELFPDTVSPVRADALLRGYLGTFGSLIMDTSTVIAETLSDNPTPAKRVDEIPVVRRFVRADPPKYTRFLDDFYDLREEVTQIVRTSRELMRQGEKEAAYNLISENPEAAAFYKITNKASKRLSSWSREMQRIRQDKTMSSDEKRRRLDEIYAARNALAKRVVEASAAR